MTEKELAEVGERLRKAAEVSVPNMLAPADRMAKIRRLARRNRRIRAIAFAAPVLALATAASLLLQGTGPALPDPAAGGLVTPSGSPATTSGASLRTMPLTGAEPGLQINAPVTWLRLLPRKPDGTPVPPGVYLSSVPAQAGRAGPCLGTLAHAIPKIRNLCLPIAKLPPHQGVLVYWEMSSLPAPKISEAIQLQHVTPNDACRKIGGTTAFTQTYTTPFGHGAMLTAYACLATPDAAVINEVVDVLKSVRPTGSH